MRSAQRGACASATAHQPDARARAAAPATFPQRVLVIADLGMSYNSTTTMQHVYVRASRLPAWVTVCRFVPTPASVLALHGHCSPCSGSNADAHRLGARRLRCQRAALGVPQCI